MPDGAHILPARTLHPRPPGQGVGPAIWALLGLGLFAGFLVFLAAWVGPEIVTDWQIRDTAVPVKAGHLENGHCSTKLFLHMCDATLSAAGPGGRVVRSVHFVFASFHLGDFTANVVADPAHREWLTTDLALENLRDRIITFVALAAFLVAIIGAYLWKTTKAWRIRADWRRAGAQPVSLRLLGQVRARDGTTWHVSGAGAEARWKLPRRAKPFTLGQADVVLGLRRDDTGAVMPLDAGLRWVDLTGPERAAALSRAN